MDFQLLFEKIYWALIKRTRTKKQKSYKWWLSKGYLNVPEVSFIIQSHNKSTAVMHIVKRLRTYTNAEIIVIDDGSTLYHTKRLTKFLSGGNEFLVRANDLYEIVMYDKCIRFANGEFIVLLQDDDEIPDVEWVKRGISYFRTHQDMVILGGRDGATYKFETDAIKLDCERGKSMKHFQFAQTVNRAPMLISKYLYMKCLTHLDFSFAPFLFDDAELCMRAWMSGLKVGWYDVKFTSLMAGGMRIWNNGFTKEQCEKNFQKLRELYSSHIDAINQKVDAANAQIFSYENPHSLNI